MDDPEKIGRNSNRKKSRTMADAGNEDHNTCNQRNIRRMKQGTTMQQPLQKCTYLIWTTHHSAKH